MYLSTFRIYRQTLYFRAPASLDYTFIAIGYIDPGNFAANIESSSFGATCGDTMGDLMAMLIQYLSAKLGIVTGKNLPEHLRIIFQNGQ